MGARCVSRAPPLACALTRARGKPSSRRSLEAGRLGGLVNAARPGYSIRICRMSFENLMSTQPSRMCPKIWALEQFYLKRGGNMLLPTAKKQMRKLVAQRVGALDESAIREQSAAVAHHLFGLDAFVSCCTVSLYLSMKGEICTWPIVERLFAEDKSVFVPQVCARRCAPRANLTRCIAQVSAPSRPTCACCRRCRSTKRGPCRSTGGGSRRRPSSGRPPGRTRPRRAPSTWCWCRASPSIRRANASATAEGTTVSRRVVFGARRTHSHMRVCVCFAQMLSSPLSSSAARSRGRARGHGRPVLARANRQRGPRRRRRPAHRLRGPSRRRLSARRAVHAGRLLLLEPARARVWLAGLATHTQNPASWLIAKISDRPRLHCIWRLICTSCGCSCGISTILFCSELKYRPCLRAVCHRSNARDDSSALRCFSSHTRSSSFFSAARFSRICFSFLRSHSAYSFSAASRRLSSICAASCAASSPLTKSVSSGAAGAAGSCCFANASSTCRSTNCFAVDDERLSAQHEKSTGSITRSKTCLLTTAGEAAAAPAAARACAPPRGSRRSAVGSAARTASAA